MGLTKEPSGFCKDQHQRDEALKEYYFLEDLIDRYDEKSLKIKSWSVTSSAVALGVGFTEDKPVLFALAVTGCVIFWYLDGLWVTYQSFYASRAAVLEDALNSRALTYPGPGIVSAFRMGLRAKLQIKKIPEMIFSRRVWLPHSIILLFGIFFSLGSILFRH